MTQQGAALVLATLGGVACGSAVDLPAVKPQRRLAITCQGPEVIPPGQACSSIDACGLRPQACNSSITVVAQVDERGSALEAHVLGPQPPGFAACLLQEAKRWTFLPALDCRGHSIPGEYTGTCGTACDHADATLSEGLGSSESPSGRTRS